LPRPAFLNTQKPFPCCQTSSASMPASAVLLDLPAAHIWTSSAKPFPHSFLRPDPDSASCYTYTVKSCHPPRQLLQTDAAPCHCLQHYTWPSPGNGLDWKHTKRESCYPQAK